MHRLPVCSVILRELSLANDQWIKVKGTTKLQVYQNQEIPVVEVEMLKLIDSPATPYVY